MSGALSGLSSSGEIDSTLPTRKLLAVGCRILSLHGHDDFNQGQISARRHDSPDFLIKVAQRGFDDACPDDMVACAVAQDAVVPPEAPPEAPLHQAIYAARLDVGAIVHSHAESATIFGATDLQIVPISHEGAFFKDEVSRFDETSHTILDHDTGGAVARALGQKSALLLCNHGLVVVAATVRRAVILTLMLERACRLQLLAESLQRSYRTTRDEEVEKKRRYIYSDVAIRNYWNHAAQAACRAFPDAQEWRSPA